MLSALRLAALVLFCLGLPASLAAAPPAARAPGFLDARIPADAEGFFCLERPGDVLADTATLFGRLRALGGSDAGWTGLAARATRANLLGSLDKAGLERAGLDAGSDVCVWARPAGPVLVWPVVDAGKAWDTGRRLALLLTADDADKAKPGKGKAGKPAALPPGKPDRPLRVGKDAGATWLVIRDGLLLIGSSAEALEVAPPSPRAGLADAVPVVDGQRRARFALRAGSEEGMRVPIGGVWAHSATGWAMHVRGALPLEVLPFALALAPDAADQTALAQAVAPYVPDRAQVLYASFGLGRLLALLAVSGDPTAGMPPLAREALAGLRGSFGLVLPHRLLDTRLVLPVRDPARARAFVDLLVAQLGQLDLDVRTTRRVQGPRTEILLEILPKNEDFAVVVLPIAVVLEPDRLVLRLLEPPRPEATVQPLPPLPQGSVLHIAAPARFDFAGIAAMASSALPFTRGGLREGVSWGQAFALLLAEVRSQRGEVVIESGAVAYRAEAESAPLAGDPQAVAYAEALRAIFAGDQARYGEQLSKVLALGPETYWGRRAHDELYAPSSWIALYSIGTLAAVAVPNFMSYLDRAKAMRTIGGPEAVLEFPEEP